MFFSGFIKRSSMKQSNTKEDKNPILEGTGKNRIDKSSTDNNEKSYPLPSTKDKQYKDQPEFIEPEPNKKDEQA
jgi:hypothetical protein